jgi:hypothetical protein
MKYKEVMVTYLTYLHVEYDIHGENAQIVAGVLELPDCRTRLDFENNNAKKYFSCRCTLFDLNITRQLFFNCNHLIRLLNFL